MTSGYLPAKIAFLVLALFVVSYQCAAQCTLQPCHKEAAKVPPCHRQQAGEKSAPGDSCKSFLPVAEEVRISSIEKAPIAPFVFVTIQANESLHPVVFVRDERLPVASPPPHLSLPSPLRL